MDWNQAKDEILKYLAVGGVALLLWFFRSLIATMKDLKKAIDALNLHAVEFSKDIEFQQEQMKELRFRLKKIEGRA